MAEMQNYVCNVCGGSLKFDESGKRAVCKYCSSEFFFKEEKGPALIMALNNAAGYLNRNDFDNAIVHYESVLKEYPKDAEAAWGHAISTYGIVYAKDDRTGQMIPTCSRIIKESILENRSYQLAISECAEEQRPIYEQRASFIDRIQKKIKRAMEDEEDFDVFISFKAKDERGIATEDSVIARNIYDELKKRGIKAFFSEVTLRDRLGDEYEPIIYRALYSCKFFILVSTKDEYIEAPWVKNEWTRFRDRVIDEGLSGSCTAVFKNISAYSLPRVFQTQGIELEKHPFDYAQLIADNLSVKFGLTSKEKEALDEQRRRNAELEEKQRMMEEELQRLRAESARPQPQPQQAPAIDKDTLMSMLREIEQSRTPAPAPAPAPAANTTAENYDTSEYDVVLKVCGPRKLEVIKALREITGLGLKDSKDLTESAPCVIMTVTGRPRANSIAERLRILGSTVEIKLKNASFVASAPTSDNGVYDVVLVRDNGRKLNAIQLVREILGLGLKDAKDLVESAPKTVITVNDRSEADRIANRFREIGASVEIRNGSGDAVAPSVNLSKSNAAEEAAKAKAAEEAKRKAEEAAKAKAAEEARRKAEEAAKAKAAEEAKRRAEEAARIKAAEEARLKAVEEMKRQKELEANFTIENGFIKKYIGTAKNVEIPRSIKGIAKEAFKSNSNIVSVSIPESVKSIGEYAFAWCSNLTTVKVAPGVVSIGFGAFQSCAKLESFEIPATVTTMGPFVFSHCESLKTIVIPGGIRTIDQESFACCTSLTHVKICNGVNYLKWGVFTRCSALKSVEIPHSIKEIEWRSFKKCDALTDVYYTAGESDWRNLTIGSANDALQKAKKHFYHKS